MYMYQVSHLELVHVEYFQFRCDTLDQSELGDISLPLRFSLSLRNLKKPVSLHKDTVPAKVQLGLVLVWCMLLDLCLMGLAPRRLSRILRFAAGRGWRVKSLPGKPTSSTAPSQCLIWRCPHTHAHNPRCQEPFPKHPTPNAI